MIYPIKGFTEISVNYITTSPGKKTPENMSSRFKKISDSQLCWKGDIKDFILKKR